DNLNDCINKNSACLNVESFKLRQNISGNSFLLPLFSIKHENGKEIESSFEKILDYSSEVSADNTIKGTTLNFLEGVHLKHKGKILPYRFDYTTKLFLFRKPSTDNWFLYLLLKFKHFEASNIVNQEFKIRENEVSMLYFRFIPKNISKSIFFKTKDLDTTKEYTIEFSEDLPEIDFLVYRTEDHKFTLSDTNVDDKHGIMKRVKEI
ncbi:hypothetical protein CDIK_4582, partial [Cucumispora dikerogammari]